MASPPSAPSERGHPLPALHGGWPTIGGVVANLDSEVLRVVRAPGELESRVRDVVILDQSDPHSVHAGAIVLAVGLAGSEGDAVTLIDRAGRCDAAAVVFRTDDELPARLLEIADSLDLAVLTVPPEMRWGQLYSLMRTAILSAGAPGEPDAAGVPLGDLFAFADAVAAAVGGPVTIEDPHWRVLAYANLEHPIDEARRQTILGRAPPAEWQRRLEEASVARALRTGEEVVRFAGFEDEGLAPRLAAPVRAGSELLGSIWVAEGNHPLGADAEDALLRAAQLAAIHLVSHRASDDVKRRTRGAFVRELLEGRVPRTIPGAEPTLQKSGPFTVIAFKVTGGHGLGEVGHPERILSIVSLYCEDAHPEAMCALVDDRFWALLPNAHARERTLKLAAKIVDRVEDAMHMRLAVGIGARVPAIGEVPRSRRAAEQALKVLSGRGMDGGVVDIEDVRAHAILLELMDLAAAQPSLVQGKVRDLIAHDREHGTAHADTLRVYLDSWGDSGVAARRVGVHPNTMRYRVRRLVELSGLDLHDPDERCVTELQLRMLAGEVDL